MARPRAPLFVERRTYRRRRLIDAARLLPAAGLVALLLPALWARSGATSTASEALYLFGLWGLLIAAAAAMSGPLRRAATGEAEGAGAAQSHDAPGGPAPPGA